MLEKKNEMSEKLIWTANDEYPTVIECENVVDTKDRLNCFYEYLYEYLSNNLKNNDVKNLEFNDSIMIKIIVDKNMETFTHQKSYSKIRNIIVKKSTPLYMNFLTQCLKLFQQLKLTMESR